MTKQLFKLYHRCHRLYFHESRGTGLNKRWYFWLDLLLFTFDELELLGVDTVNCVWIDECLQTPESQLVLKTLI
jgi:hypothetical protein